MTAEDPSVRCAYDHNEGKPVLQSSKAFIWYLVFLSKIPMNLYRWLRKRNCRQYSHRVVIYHMKGSRHWWDMTLNHLDEPLELIHPFTAHLLIIFLVSGRSRVQGHHTIWLDQKSKCLSQRDKKGTHTDMSESQVRSSRPRPIPLASESSLPLQQPKQPRLPYHTTSTHNSMNDITSSLGNFELVDHEVTTSPLDWKPPHWLPIPVSEDYDIFRSPWLRPEQIPMSFYSQSIMGSHLMMIHNIPWREYLCRWKYWRSVSWGQVSMW